MYRTKGRHPRRASRSAELRLRFLLQDAIDIDVELLVVEGHIPRDVPRFREGSVVSPHEVVVRLTVDRDGPVSRCALVRAVGRRIGGGEVLEPTSIFGM